ncbi:hypothetical protein Ancab_027453 [Ancistrocladus abbreviatus]
MIKEISNCERRDDVFPLCNHVGCLLFVIFSNQMYGSQINGRKCPEEYWKDVMKDQAMPEAIKGLLNHDEKVDAEEKTRVHFKRNFDTRSTALIYLQVDPKVEGKP